LDIGGELTSMMDEENATRIAAVSVRGVKTAAAS
jgi:hypothetical protein